MVAQGLRAQEVQAEVAIKGPSIREPSQQRPKQDKREHREKVGTHHEGQGLGQQEIQKHLEKKNMEDSSGRDGKSTQPAKARRAKR